jgi:hypothetical protein
VFGQPQRIYHGVWGSAPFQSIYQPAHGALGALGALPLLPEWYLLIAGLAGLGALGVLWPPLRFAVFGLALAVAAVIAQAAKSAAHARLRDPSRGTLSRWKMRTLIFLLHLLQPAARLWGRVRHGLAPWRPRGGSRWTLPRPRRLAIWSEQWRPHTAWLEALETALRESRALVRRGGEWDRFELAVHGGPCGAARVRLAVEEHGEGRQYLRFRVWPKLRRGLTLSLLGGALAAAALADQAWLAGGVLVGVGLALPLAALRECGCAQAEIESALRRMAAAVGSDAGGGREQR